MAWAERTGSSGGFTKRLFKPVGQALLWADIGAVAGAGVVAIGGVGY